MPSLGKPILPLEIKNEFTPDEPIGCHLQSIGGVGGCLSLPTAKAYFETLCKQGHGKGNGTYKGQYITGTIVSIADYHKNSTGKELEEMGFKLLGIQKGGHGAYKMLLYGLGFELPNEKKEKKSAD